MTSWGIGSRVEGVGLKEAEIVESEEGACSTAIVGLADADGADGSGNFHRVVHQSVGHLIVGAEFQLTVDGGVDMPVEHK
jgi:hypothetical protein